MAALETARSAARRDRDRAFSMAMELAVLYDVSCTRNSKDSMGSKDSSTT